MTSLTPQLRIGARLAEVLVNHAGMLWRDAERAALGMLERVGRPCRTRAGPGDGRAPAPGACHRWREVVYS